VTPLVIDLVLIVALIAGLVSGRVPMPMLLLGFIVAVVVLGRMPFSDVLEMLADPAVFIVVCFILFARVLSQLHWLRAFVFGKPQPTERRTLLRFLAAVGAVSAVMPNTAVVGTFMGPATRHPSLPGHKLLLPLSFMALAGGMVTQFGTSANLVVVAQAGRSGVEVGLVDFLFPGLAVYAAVLAILVLATPLVLKDPAALRASGPAGSPALRAGQRDGDAGGEAAPPQQGGEADLFHIEARVKRGSPLIGRSILENGLRSLEHFYVAELVRGTTIISPVTPGEVIQERDILILTGDVRQIAELQTLPGLQTAVQRGAARKQTLYHAIVGRDSNLVGTTLSEVGFRARYDASVVAIQRGTQQLSGKLGDIRLRRADLLVIAAGSEFFQRSDVRPHLLPLDVEDPGQNPLPLRESVFAGVMFLALVLASALGVMKLEFAVFLMLLGAMAAGWLSVREVRRFFPFDMVVLLWGSLVLGALVDRSGIDEHVATFLSHASFGGQALPAMIVLFFVTWILTELLSNSGAALVALPIALELARQLGVPPEAFVLVVAFGASASFIIPFGYQTHLMVMTAGGYDLSHFVKLGLLVLAGYAVACLTVIGVIWL
jgi:di/tricarboxylate transporter